MLTGSLSSLVGKLESLQQLYINDCNLTGSIPDEIGKLSNLGTSMHVVDSIFMKLI
jgi:Leucine-rich repeat (LRR) protein